MQPKCHPGILVAALCLIVAYPVAGAPQCKDESNPVAHVPGHTFNGDKNALATIGQSTIDQRSAIYAEHVVQQPTPRIIMYKRPTARVPELREKTVEEVPALLGDNLLLGTVHDQNPQWIVEKQNPPSGRDVPICTHVDLWMKPPPAVVVPPQERTTTVPDIRQWNQDRIPSMLEHYRLKYAGTTEKDSTEAPPGSIFDQNPKPGTQVPWGTEVFGYRAKSPPPQPPLRIELTTNAASTLPGEKITLTATLEPALVGAKYMFDVGDGRPSIDSEKPQIRYAYEKDGNYPVRATAIVDGRQVQSDELDITVHEVIYTVTLERSPHVAQKGQAVEFRARVWPPQPPNANPEYIFDFGDRTNPVRSNSPTYTHAFLEARTYEARVTLLLEHKHKIPSAPVEVAIVIQPLPLPPPWVYIAIGTALAICGFGGFRWLRNFSTRGVNVETRPGTGQLCMPEIPGGVVEAGFGFRVGHPAIVASVEWRGPVVTRIERRK